MIPENDRRDLFDLLWELNAGHLSSVYASCEEPEARVVVVKDSANCLFLARLTELQLALELPLPPELPADHNLAMFAINEDAKAYVKMLIDTFVNVTKEAESGQ